MLRRTGRSLRGVGERLAGVRERDRERDAERGVTERRGDWAGDWERVGERPRERLRDGEGVRDGIAGGARLAVEQRCCGGGGLEVEVEVEVQVQVRRSFAWELKALELAAWRPSRRLCRISRKRLAPLACRHRRPVAAS